MPGRRPVKKGSFGGHFDELERVLSESDPNPTLRLENAVAKRRARRYLTSDVVGTECFDPKG